MADASGHPLLELADGDAGADSLWQAIVDTLAANIAVVDASGTILAVNQSWVNFGADNGLPMTKEAWKGVNYLAICRQAVLSREPGVGEVLAGVEAVLQGQRDEFAFEYPCHAPTQRRWFAMDVRRCGDHAAVITHVDMTQRKLAEDALADEKRFVEAVFSSLPGIAFVFDEDGRRVRRNDQYAQLLGWSESELDQMRAGGAAIPDDRPRIAQAVSEAFRNGRVELEVTGATKDGRQIPFLCTGVRVELAGRAYVVGVGIDITQRKQAEESLRQSQENLRRLWDGAADALCLCDQHGRILDVNRLACDSLGYSREELLAMSVSDVEMKWDPSIVELLRERIRQEQTPTIAAEGVHRRRDASTFPVQVHVAAFEVGGRLLLLAAASDITKRVQAEQSLRQAQELYQKLFDLSPEVIVLTTEAEGRYIAANAAHERIVGYRQEELIGRTAIECGVWASPAERQRVIQRLREEGSLHNLQTQFRRKSGELFPVELSMARVEIEGRPCLISLLIDVTERTRAEEALRRSEAGLAAAQRLAHIGSWQWDTAANTASWSDETYRIFGIDPGPLRQHRQDFVTMVHPDDRSRVDKALSDALSGDKEYDLEYRIVWPDGSERVIHSQAAVVRDDTGRAVLMHGTVHDITDRKVAEEALRQAKENLEQKVRDRTAKLTEQAAQLRAMAIELTRAEQRERRRIAGVLHDHLQQLLVSAKLHLEILSRHNNDLVKQTTCQIKQVIDEAIRSSRSLTAELSPAVLQETDLEGSLRWLSGWMAEKYRLDVEVSVAPDLPFVADDIKVLVFESVRELLFNVVKHAHVAFARVSAGVNGESALQITVADKGGGFNPEKIGQAGKGASFGLFSIRQRLNLMGGQMAIDSVPGKGSHITLTVPVAMARNSP